MKVGVYFLNALIALWVGIGGFQSTIGGAQWEKAKAYLNTLESKVVLDDILVPMSTIAPGYWLLTVGGLIVLFIILTGLMRGRSATREAAASAPPARRRRR